ncbi:MAG: hypothetical protein AB8D52_11355 [Gammaproteobacteria bacterium]
MRSIITFIFLIFITPLNSCAMEERQEQITTEKGELTWEPGINVELFWMNYANSKGGLTWGKSASYPKYKKVKEGDSFIIQLKEGPCLMEFFHARWRRANDVRRWDESINAYGGCPYVFD